MKMNLPDKAYFTAKITPLNLPSQEYERNAQAGFSN